MLSLRVIGLRDVPRPPPSVWSEITTSVLWSVQVSYAAQQHRTHFAALPRFGDDDKEEGHITDRLSAPRTLWTEEIEIEDKAEEETVTITLLFDLSPKATRGRKLFRHSVTTIEMRTFRAEPEKRIELWQPLRSVSPSNLDQDYGAIQLAMTYTDDYVAQGYMFGLFCGLGHLHLSQPC